MNKQNLFQKTILAGVMACALGLGACTTTDDNIWWNEDETTARAEQDDETILLAAEIEPCRSEDDTCVLSDDYLTGSFIQTETKNGVDLPMFGDDGADDVIAVSRPSGPKAVAVKDKSAPAAQSTPADKVLYSTQAIPETVDATTKTTVVPVVAVAPAPVVVADPAKTERVEAKTEVKPEPKPEVKVEEKVVTPTPKQEPVEVAVETTVPPAETAETLQTAISVPGQMMPLKKVKTTITETTTKVKQEQQEDKVEPDFKKMSLKEKVAYGEKTQEWEAKAGNTLRGLLMDWGNKSGWTVVWKLDRDYHLEAGVVFQGTFVDVSGALVRSFARATPAPIGTFYQGNRVLVISTQEDENER